MARLRGKSGPKPKTAAAPADAAPPATRLAGLPLPSVSASAKVLVADVVLRAAGSLLRDRMEKGLVIKSHGKTAANRMVDGRSLATTAVLWGASRLARRSPVGLAVVAGGLAAKALYDRGKRIERERKAVPPASEAPGEG